MGIGKYVIVYDISDDKERSRVSKVLEGYGFRVQESAFECVLSHVALDKLRLEIENLGIETGFVNIYRVSDNAKMISIGKAPERPPDSDSAFVV